MNMTMAPMKTTIIGPNRLVMFDSKPSIFPFLVAGRSLQHLFQLAAALAAADQVDHHGREEFACGQRSTDGCTFAHP